MLQTPNPLFIHAKKNTCKLSIVGSRIVYDYPCVTMSCQSVEKYNSFKKSLIDLQKLNHKILIKKMELAVKKN